MMSIVNPMSIAMTKKAKTTIAMSVPLSLPAGHARESLFSISIVMNL
jgi:hypothetical protein